MGRKQEIGWIFMTVIAVCGLMIFVEQVIQPVYVMKSAIKVILFIGGIIAYCILYKETLVSFRFKTKEMKPILLIAISVYALILICFFFLRDFMDINQIRESLMGKEGIDGRNFIFVAIYISVVNSFIEELFFRGLVFKRLKTLEFQCFPHVFSAGSFAIYHIGIISGWFSVPMILLMITALFAAGIALNMFCQYTDSVLGSWAIHISANLAINTIGFMIL